MPVDGQLGPDFEVIIPLCQRELDIKYPEYGNNWVGFKSEYWVPRIANEVDEYKNSMSRASEKRKLLNIINLAAMAWHNLHEVEV